MPETTPHIVQQRYETVTERIADAAEASGRDASQVTLVAVTKYTDMPAVRTLYDLGHRDFGESRAQQLAPRVEATDSWAVETGTTPDIRWHMIGHLQRNKVKTVLPLTTLIHSVDSFRLADEIEKRADADRRPAHILMQVNMSGEQSKYGIDPDEAESLFDHIVDLDHVQLRGVMTMARHFDDPAQARPTFDRTRELFLKLRETERAGPAFDTLSMGMTNDFEIAIAAGSTMVRVGRALFADPDESD